MGEADESDGESCSVCHGHDSLAGNEMLLCDGCPRGLHPACGAPDPAPKGKWFCDVCVAAGKGRRCLVCRKQGHDRRRCPEVQEEGEEEDEDEDEEEEEKVSCTMTAGCTRMVKLAGSHSGLCTVGKRGSAAAAGTSDAPPLQPTPQRRCRECNGIGHDRRTCPLVTQGGKGGKGGQKTALEGRHGMSVDSAGEWSCGACRTGAGRHKNDCKKRKKTVQLVLREDPQEEDGAALRVQSNSRRPGRGVNLEKGLKLDLEDPRGHWYSGNVLEIDDAKGSVKVHYDGYVCEEGREEGGESEKRRDG